LKLHNNLFVKFLEEGNTSRSEKFAQQYALFVEKCMKIDFFKHGSDEMLIGRAGYLSI
jgi:hypothetical protein